MIFFPKKIIITTTIKKQIYIFNKQGINNKQTNNNKEKYFLVF